MKASSVHELEIARLVDQRAIEHKLPLSAVAEIATAIPFAMSEAETQFLIRYIIWRRDHPIANIMDSRTAAILAQPPHHGHIVYPSTDDRGLVEVVGFYTSNGLASGNAVILIATEAHVHAIKRYLKSDGNVEALEASGQLSFFDTAELMSVFMVDGNPDPKLFKEGIKTLIEQARRDGDDNREVRLFGEISSLLWPTNSAAAESIEQLCNEVIEEYSIPILCAYSVGGPGRGQLSESLIKAHSHAIA